MHQRSCSTPGCDKPHRAHGLCSTHYNHANVRPIEAECAGCGRIVVKTNQWARARYRSVCSYACRSFVQNGRTECRVPDTHPSRSSRVPDDHPSRVQLSCPVPADHSSRIGPQPCRWCGSASSEWMGRYCSDTCRRRAKRVRRRARENDGHVYSWTQVMRVFALLDHRCAYCGERPDGPPDPDHVVPTTRHGSNGNGNILPSCRPCNSDKRDLLLHEWAEDRARRGKRPVRTVLDRSVPAFAHLLPDVIASCTRPSVDAHAA